MVMYEDDNKGDLYLRYEVVPSANEIIKDLVMAPIEFGDSFSSKKKNKKPTIDKYLIVDCKLGKKTEESIVNSIKDLMPEWKAIKAKDLLGFELEEAPESEQGNYL